MITPDGWLHWAARLEPTNRHVNPGVNPVKGAFFHSAEGYASVLLDPNSQWGYNGQFSWHFSNLLDGRFYQHYPFTARCWHATAANNDYVGGENEGYAPREKSLTQAQVDNLVRLTRDLEEWKGWKASRTGDRTQTLWEHREVVWLGGTATSCPNGRIPWAAILAQLGGNDPMDAEREEELGHQRARGYLLDALLRDYDVVPVAEPGNGVLIVELRREGQPPITVPVPMRPEVRRGR